MKICYYPGCTLKTKAKDLDVYARKSAEALADAARVIRVMEGSEYNAPERSQKPLTDDDLTLVVGGLTMPDLPFLRPLGRSVPA